MQRGPGGLGQRIDGRIFIDAVIFHITPAALDSGDCEGLPVWLLKVSTTEYREISHSAWLILEGRGKVNDVRQFSRLGVFRRWERVAHDLKEKEREQLQWFEEGEEETVQLV